MGTTIGCIGAGNIVKAILSGVENSGNYTQETIGIFDVSRQVCEEYKSNGYTIYESIEELVKGSGLVVVAVTPQIVASIMDNLKSSVSADTVLLSLVTGISNDWYLERLGPNCKVVRCMPTLTAQVGLGAFAVTRAATVSYDDYKEVDHFLTSCGIVEEIPESLMCEVVPINGSAPAYFFHITRVVVEEAIRMGLSDNVALRLFAQTMKGSAEMLLNSGINAEALEGKLRLPGAATVAALDKMDELGLVACLQEGIKACVAQCRELGKL
jgi:pyrroline-5-carboxylate reductase